MSWFAKPHAANQPLADWHSRCLTNPNHMDLNGSLLTFRPAKHQLTEAVLGYLLRHPEAHDTLDGIAEWWLLERRVTEALANVAAALSELVSKDFVIASSSREGRVYYKLNRAMQREALAHLKNRAASQAQREVLET